MVNLGLAWWELGRYEKARTQWEEAIASVTHPERRTNAVMGLGNVALRTGHLEAASDYFHEAFQQYEAQESIPDLQARALNNLLITAVRVANKQIGTWAFETGLSLVDVVQSPVLRGELSETLAEWTITVGNTERTMQLLNKAKKDLASEPVLSWFSARFLEIYVQSTNTEQVSQRLAEMDTMVNRVRDPQLVATIRLRMAQVALAFDVQPHAKEFLNSCLTLFPPMGGVPLTYEEDK